MFRELLLLAAQLVLWQAEPGIDMPVAIAGAAARFAGQFGDDGIRQPSLVLQQGRLQRSNGAPTVTPDFRRRSTARLLWIRRRLTGLRLSTRLACRAASLFKAIGKVAQCVGGRSHGADRFAPHLRNHRIIDVSDGVSQFHLDELNGLFNSLAYTTRTRSGRVLSIHGRNLSFARQSVH